MHKQYLVICIFANILLAQNLAISSQIEPLKSFNPPNLITPNIAQSYFFENQFDLANRQNYYFVTDNIDNSMDKFHITSGIYGKSFYNSVLFKYRDSNYYTILNLNHTKANKYKDGNGNKVNFGYERFNQSLILGFVPNENLEARLTVLHDDIDDDKQPEHKMDPVNTDRIVVKVDTRIGKEDLSNTLNLNFKYINLDRTANNFEIRNYNPNKMVFLDLKRNLYNISASYDIDFKNFHNSFNLSYEKDKHEGKRYKKTPLKDIFNAYRFANVDQDTYSLFNTLSYNFNELNKISLGLEYIYNNAKVKKFNERIPNPMMMSYFPNAKMLWKKYYDINFDGSKKTNLFNAKLQYEYTPNDLQKYSIEIARVARLPINPERFSSLVGGVVSNPNLKAEKHNFIKFSFDIKNENYKGYLNSFTGLGLNFGGSIKLSDVEDLIIYDRARGQKGIMVSDNSLITRNVDVKIYSINSYLNINFLKNFGAKIDLQYNYGENDTDNRALYQIRPFEANLNLDYKDYATFGSYNLGAALRYVAKQNRGDFDKTKGLGIDLEEAAKSFTTLDIYGGINLKDDFGIRVGVNNIFDKKYAEFISGNHVQALSPNLVNAPGRTFYLSFHKKF
ncbi:TonB-dependent receptor [Campylobacter blaseri]|uniref:TonB-dependent receptor n=1 Tax=Campylobacter blaseri TaxID=2042961 RepID=A0A2P8R3K5_9BACT|nr:TonB-dependent receptor [Campylobacter blaseri]PSM53086.1 TonB-dependent receptor [Campylobacter blaseri]PSM54553.1 TonB-dependent receptor [Campylobacter blaseri]QKF86976.1 TonB-dependent receptor [Campylobacter blaseri]